MGLKSSALILVTGAALATYAIPEARQSVSQRVDSTIEAISNLLYSTDPSIRSKKNLDGSSPLRPLQQPYLNRQSQLESFNDSLMDTPMLDSDGNYTLEYMGDYMHRCPPPGHNY